MRKYPNITIVIPCYNEESYIRKTVETVLESFKDETLEIIVVNDGSSDASQKILEEMSAREPSVHFLTHTQNQGKGAAIKSGIMKADGDILAFIDGDGEVDCAYLVSAISLLRENTMTDIIIGNRYLIPNGYKTSSIRRFYSKVYQLLNWLLFSLTWRDTQAGMKVFRYPIGKDLFNESDVSGYAFDIHILVLAYLRGYRIEEYPITQILKGQSSITKKHILQMMIDTVRAYRHFTVGKFKLLLVKKEYGGLCLFLLRQLLAVPSAIAIRMMAGTALFLLNRVRHTKKEKRPLLIATA